MNRSTVIDGTCEITLQTRCFTERVTEAISNWWEPVKPRKLLRRDCKPRQPACLLSLEHLRAEIREGL